MPEIRNRSIGNGLYASFDGHEIRISKPAYDSDGHIPLITLKPKRFYQILACRDEIERLIIEVKPEVWVD